MDLGRLFPINPDGTPRRPAVGDKVFYFAYGSPGGEFPAGEKRLAFITETYPGNPFDAEQGVKAGLVVLNTTGLYFNRGIPHGAGQAGHWCWPEEIEAETNE